MSQNLPEDHESEASLLATCAAPGNEALASEVLPTLREEDFVHPAHRAIFRALLRLLDAQVEVNSLTLRDGLQNTGELGRVGGYAGLLELLGAEEVGRPSVLADILRSKRRLRELIRLAATIDREAGDHGNPESILDHGMKELHRISVDGESQPSQCLKELLPLVANGEAIGKVLDNVFRFALPTLDRVIVAPPGGVVLLGARPGTGKTALAVQTACETARNGGTVLFISLELLLEDANARQLAYFTKLAGMSFRQATYDAGEASQQLQKELAALSRIWTIAPNTDTPWAKLEAEIRRHVKRFGVTAVVIDYFSLIGRTFIKGSNEAYAYASVSERITCLAKDLRIGILLLAQLVKDSDGIKPTLGGIADSDRPARDCWAAILLWGDQDRGFQAALVKNRGGSAGWQQGLKLNGAINHFTEIEPSATNLTPKKLPRRLG